MAVGGGGAFPAVAATALTCLGLASAVERSYAWVRYLHAALWQLAQLLAQRPEDPLVLSSSQRCGKPASCIMYRTECLAAIFRHAPIHHCWSHAQCVSCPPIYERTHRGLAHALLPVPDNWNIIERINGP